MVWSKVLILAPLFILLAWAAAMDMRTRRIPNWLSFSLIATGLICSFTSYGTLAPKDALYGFLVGLGIPFCLFAIGVLGPGDVKLLAGVGAWLGVNLILKVLIVTTILGGALALLWGLWFGRLRAVSRNTAVLALNMVSFGQSGLESGVNTSATNRKDLTLPYALPILLATLGVVAFSIWKGR